MYQLNSRNGSNLENYRENYVTLCTALVLMYIYMCIYSMYTYA